jgi:hypothetical protein
MQLHKHHELHAKLSIVNWNHGEVIQEDLPNLNLDEGLLRLKMQLVRMNSAPKKRRVIFLLAQTKPRKYSKKPKIQ